MNGKEHTLKTVDFEGTTVNLNRVNFLDFEYGTKESIKFFTRMANAVEKESDYLAYQVGAVIAGKTKSGKTFFIPATNQVPEKLQGIFPIENIKVYGNGSATSHAEMVALDILSRIDEDIENIEVFTSRTPCPSCYKMLSIYHNTLGKPSIIDGVYTDGKTISGVYEKENKGKISPVALWKKARRMLALIGGRGNLRLNFVNPDKDSKNNNDIKERKSDTTPKIIKTENNAFIKYLTTEEYTRYQDYELLAIAQNHALRSPFTNQEEREAVLAFGRNQDGDMVVIGATNSLPPGFTVEKDEKHLAINKKANKESYNIRTSAAEYALGYAWRNNITMEKIVSTKAPVPGVLLNLVNNGITEIITPPGRLDIENDPNHLALYQLKQTGVINHKFVHADASMVNGIHEPLKV